MERLLLRLDGEYMIEDVEVGCLELLVGPLDGLIRPMEFGIVRAISSMIMDRKLLSKYFDIVEFISLGDVKVDNYGTKVILHFDDIYNVDAAISYMQNETINEILVTKKGPGTVLIEPKYKISKWLYQKSIDTYLSGLSLVCNVTSGSFSHPAYYDGRYIIALSSHNILKPFDALIKMGRTFKVMKRGNMTVYEMDRELSSVEISRISLFFDLRAIHDDSISYDMFSIINEHKMESRKSKVNIQDAILKLANEYNVNIGIMDVTGDVIKMKDVVCN